jgi:hypothetical protein
MNPGLLKPLPLLFLAASMTFAQSLRFGVEGGVPLADAFHARSTSPTDVMPGSRTSYTSSNKRYVAGVTGELSLPFHLSVKADLLYRRLGYDSATSRIGAAMTAATTGNAWETPLVAKYRLRSGGLLDPYIEGGISFRTLQGLHQTVVHVCTGCLDQTPTVTTTDHPAELQNSVTKGIVAGAGLEFRHLLAGLFGEIRYTRWTSDAFSSTDGLLVSTRNQADLLVGITF